MSSKQHETIYLEDYQPPAWLISHTELRFELEEEQTLVRAQLSIQANPAVADKRKPLELFGDEAMELCRLSIDGQILEACDYQREAGSLYIDNVPESFTLECVTRLLPHENMALEGLYKSDGMFCTQCEAEGFRRITFFPDRPDVMSIFTTTLVADKARYPVLLSNGNPVDTGEDGEGRHWVTWEDPWPKPSYLFALVAGDLALLEDRYTTTSGREVALQIYAERKDLDKLDYAMKSLKNAMRWDEDVYGREYDLDIYMIVAVDFFNMGAMENKGLNIFNTSCVLAHPRTTTDQGFQRVEGVVAHEYFHNWSGNRVTCRDWFQLSLKEGFTVFRDAEFSADMNSRTVKRIEDVALLRTAQFAEDAGPMAHPVRPESYMEISNFYTLTVYEKGAEVVRMLHTLLGTELFRKGSDLYFERHDGQAVTTDDFVAAMEVVSGRDLSQFKRWYSQAGTPRLQVTDEYDQQSGEYCLTVRQSCPPSPGQEHKQPYQLPLSVGLLADDGTELYAGMLELTGEEQQFRFENITRRPVPSLLRGFSAPVKLEYDYSDDQLLMLLRHDSDGFNRWDAGQRLCIRLLQEQMQRYRAGLPMNCSEALIHAWRQLLADESLDPAMVAQCLRLPSEAQLGELAECIDVTAIHEAREFMRKALAQALESEWLQVYQRCDTGDAYSPDADAVGLRSLKNLALSYLMMIGHEPWLALARQQYEQSDNMTDQLAALSLVAHSEFRETAAELLQAFYQQWQHESLVMNQWLSVQASDPTEGALERVKTLAQHPIFDARNPNKLRALIGAFCGQNLSAFHAEDGSGYVWLADWILMLDGQNPQVAARLLAPLTRWKRYDPDRAALMRAQLQRMMDTAELSADVYEVVSKSLV